jgi:hypothetical protein
MPEYRLAADLNHRLGFKLGFFRNPCAQTTSQNYCFHLYILRNYTSLVAAAVINNLFCPPLSFLCAGTE